MEIQKNLSQKINRLIRSVLTIVPTVILTYLASDLFKLVQNVQIALFAALFLIFMLLANKIHPISQ